MLFGPFFITIYTDQKPNFFHDYFQKENYFCRKKTSFHRFSTNQSDAKPSIFVYRFQKIKNKPLKINLLNLLKKIG
jgi:hypothetical protein